MLTFVAFPSQRQAVQDAIEIAAEKCSNSLIQLKPWPKMATIGLKIDDLIRDEIEGVDVLAADITYPNFNVYYEIGFAIARGKPIIPLVNASIEGSADSIQKLGLFDKGTIYLTSRAGDHSFMIALGGGSMLSQRSAIDWQAASMFLKRLSASPGASMN